MSSLDLTSTIGAISSKSSDKAGPSPKGSGPGESFGRLFGRVFGESSMRQNLAGSEVPASASKIRTVLLGSNTQVITAGEPPTEDEILAFAREANLDETSLKALLLTAPSTANAQGEEGHNLEGESLSPQLDSLTDINSASAFTFGLGEGLHVNNPLLASQVSSGLGSPVASGVLNSSTSNGSRFGMLPPLIDGAAASTSSEATSTATGGLEKFRVTLEPVAEGMPDSEHSAKDVLTSRLLTGEVDGAGGSSDKLAAKLGLGLKGISDSTSLDTLLRRIQEKKSLGIQDPIKLQLAEQAQGPDALNLDGVLDLGGDTNSDARSVTSFGGGSLEASLRSGGGSLGDGSNQSRPDPQGGKPMSQQVMQRFGEILGQRLLQQINQGDWKVEIALEPGDLGSIQIELEWRKGELEASFKAGQALTRDLLQDGLPRLRETLERSGIDVASVYVGDQGRQQTFSGGSGQSGSNGLKQSQPSDQGSGLEVQGTGPQGKRSEDGRLDVLV